MAMLSLLVNGKRHTVDVEPSTPLLYVLRNDLDLHGPRFGCGLGQCGACTVLIKGEAVRSCVRPVSQVQGVEITTLEGLARTASCIRCSRPGSTSRCRQCGFCQNGQMLTAKALLDKNPNPTDAQIREGMTEHAVPLHDLLPDSRRREACAAQEDGMSRRDGSAATTDEIPQDVRHARRRRSPRSRSMAWRRSSADGQGAGPIPTPTSGSSIPGL